MGYADCYEARFVGLVKKNRKRLDAWIREQDRINFFLRRCGGLVKGAVSRDYLPFFYFMNRTHLGP